MLPDMAKRSNGVYTTTQLQRCAQMSGSFGKEVDRLFATAGFNTFQVESANRPKKCKKMEADLLTYVETYTQDNLFKYTEGRKMRCRNLKVDCKVELKTPYKLGLHLKKLNTNMDIALVTDRETSNRDEARLERRLAAYRRMG